MMQTILITGANGFSGSHTLKWLLNQNNDSKIIAACRDRSKLPRQFQGEVREGDLRDKTYVNELLNGVDVVVNCMAWSSLWGRKSLSNALFFQPVCNLIDAYFTSNARRFVNISSSAAAAPDNSNDAYSAGISRPFWPHLCKVIDIENILRKRQTTGKSVVNMRLGIFAGEAYGLGVLPILLPRLKTHLVPWVQGGHTDLAIVDGRDLGQAMGLAALSNNLHDGYHAFNITGKEIPTVREVINFLHTEFAYPKPHFSVPFFIAYPFASLMEKIDPFVPWEPLIVRSIVHLLEETSTNNNEAERILGYQPIYHWHETIRVQLAEMKHRQTHPMSMAIDIRE
jgi:nucleoside-diphosphate-sugar epimerase